MYKKNIAKNKPAMQISYAINYMQCTKNSQNINHREFTNKTNFFSVMLINLEDLE